MKDTRLSIENLPLLPRDQESPIFNQPWKAKAFALVVRLSEAGCFTWPEWVKIFSLEIKAAQERGDPDPGDTCYQHWLNALERICAEKGLVGDEAIRRRKSTWRRAYLNTRHGQPVDFTAALNVAQRKEKPLTIQDSKRFRARRQG
jgi:nitrile hydratase accessory protein